MLRTTTYRAPGRADPLESRLRSFGALHEADLEAVRACEDDLRLTPAGMDIDCGPAPRLIVSGWAGWTKVLRDGRRQIIHICLPGDVIGFTPLAAAQVTALTAVRTADARPLAAALLSRTSDAAGLRAAWERAEDSRQRQLLEHVVRLGRLSAYERTASLLLDLMERHHRAGLSEGSRMAWPLTQEMLADVLGLSIVHVNRTLQQLRREGMIVLRAGQLQIPDVERLAEVTGFERAI